MTDISKYTGASNFKRAPEYPLNTLALNGKTGTFVLRDILAGKQPDNRYGKINLGTDTMEVVFIKIRRKLSQFRKNERSLETNEHNTKDDTVFLFGANKKGIASDLREEYTGLRTQQIVYAILKRKDQSKEIVRFVVKGSSLADADDKKTTGFYSYLASFKNGEHVHQYATVIKGVRLEGELGEYFAISFERGNKLNEEDLAFVEKSVMDVHTKLVEIDAYYNQKNGADIAKEVTPPSNDEYPEDEINPEDIPF